MAPPHIEAHKRAVSKIATQVRQFYENKEPFRISHGSTNSTRSPLFRRGNVIDTSKLSHVVEVDSERKIALVEPNVPMDRLVETTLKYGLVPPVVMEFPGITVGGGYNGTSGESSSFKHGFFDRTINKVEMVLANGDLIYPSRKEHVDLFDGAAGAVGTLGITTMVELQLMEATKFVETTYHPVTSVSEAKERLLSLTSQPESFDYIDGILFSLNEGMIITGRMTNQSPTDVPVRHFGRPIDPWFYLHVKDIFSKTKARPKPHATVELIPLDEYLFRYDRGGFWVGRSAFQYFFTPFNWLTRWWLDDYLRTRTMYTALHASGFSTSYVVQDLALPYSNVEEFVSYTAKDFGIWPLWLCPLKQGPQPTFHPHSTKREPDDQTLKPMLNVGLWGYGPTNRERFVKLNRELESKLQSLGGMKWLYANTYYSESDFWEIYGREWYDALRRKYHATSLPSVYDKVRTDVEAQKTAVKDSWWLWLISLWPISGIYGLHIARYSDQRYLGRKSLWKSIEMKDNLDVD